MDYQLLDCGDFYKIERFGKYILARPEPQALWPLTKSLDAWKQEVDAYYDRKRSDVISNKEESGVWTYKQKLDDNWVLRVGRYADTDINCKLAFTAFKHVGIFPEQKGNWEFIANEVKTRKLSGNMLNLFAYTGISSLVGAASGLKVVHVDAVKQVINWSNENRQLSNLEPTIAWVVEDAMKFLKREVSRGKLYTAIILDPPTYGRGPNGEKWMLEKELFNLLNLAKKLLAQQNSFLIINLYSLNITPMLLQNILDEAGLWNQDSAITEQFLDYGDSKKLPLGVCARIIR